MCCIHCTVTFQVPNMLRATLRHHYGALDVHRTTTQNNRTPELWCTCVCDDLTVCVCGWFRLGMTCTTFRICNLSLSVFSHKPHAWAHVSVFLRISGFTTQIKNKRVYSHVIFMCLNHSAPNVSHFTKWVYKQISSYFNLIIWYIHAQILNIGQ